MACIFKRGKTWSYSVDLGKDESGKRRKKGKGGFRTQKEAKEAAALIETEIAGGIFVDEKKITFAELAEQWFSEHQKEIKATTIESYKFTIKKLFQSFAKSLVKDITKMQYQKFLNVLFDEKYARKSIQQIHSVAKLVFRYACECDIIKNNPTAYAKIPKQKLTIDDLENNHELPKYLEKSELQLFLDTIKEYDTHNNHPLFVTLAYTGLRRGELAALKWTDIDFTNKTINVNKNVYMPKSSAEYILQTPKTKTSKRAISITDNVVKILSSHRLLQKQEQMLYRQTWHDANFVFTSPRHDGYPVRPTYVGFTMTKYLRIAGLNTNLTPHSLRHTHTSLLAEAGVSLEAIRERLGHANDNITRLIYLHVTQEIKKDAAQKFYELMNNAK